MQQRVSAWSSHRSMDAVVGRCSPGSWKANSGGSGEARARTAK
jgi:hypothetical protein